MTPPLHLSPPTHLSRVHPPQEVVSLSRTPSDPSAATAAADAELRAVALCRALRSSNTLRGFGGAALVPKRNFTLAELRLNKIEAERFLSPTDQTLERVRNGALLALGVGLAALGNELGWRLENYVEICARQVTPRGATRVCVLPFAALNPLPPGTQPPAAPYRVTLRFHIHHFQPE